MRARAMQPRDQAGVTASGRVFRLRRLLLRVRVGAPASAKEADTRTREALQFALQRGSRSGRVAWQFAKLWAGQLALRRRP